MKKSAVLLTALTVSMIPFHAFAASAAENSVDVHVMIRHEDVVLDKDITVTDADGDGELTSEDALLIAHDTYYPGGAEAGYVPDYYIWGLQGCYNYHVYAKDENRPEPGMCTPENHRTQLKDGDSLEWNLDIQLKKDIISCLNFWTITAMKTRFRREPKWM